MVARGLTLVIVLVGLAAPVVAEPIAYKGRIITVGPSPRAAACVELVRKGIDLVDGLPARLKGLGGKVRDLRCNPLPAEARHDRSEDNVTGIYMMESKDEAKGHILFRRDPAYISGGNVAVSLVTNGVYAQRHRDWIEAKKQAGKSSEARAKAERLEKIVTKSDIDLVVKAECELLDAQYGVLKALGEDANKLAGLSRFMARRGCD